MISPAIRPLKKIGKNGLYKHRPETLNLLEELVLLPDGVLLERCNIPLRDVADYVPSECLVYLVRTKHGTKEATAEKLLEILLGRLLSYLPKRSELDRGPVSLVRSNFSDEVFSNFTEMILGDPEKFDDKLDFFEFMFDLGLKRLFLDAKKMVWRREKKNVPYLVEEKTGELSEDLQKKLGFSDTFDLNEIERAELRALIRPSMESSQFSELQRHIIHLRLLGFPISSKDPVKQTIAKALNKSDRTIRTHLKLALLSLKPILNGD